MATNEQTQTSNHIQPTYTPEERALLLDLGRRGLIERAAGRFFEPDAEGIPERLKEHRACFVTLMREGELRGCIGQVRPQMPLFRAIVRNACAAGYHDTRFEPVGPSEIAELSIEISVLTLPTLIHGSPDEILSQLRRGIDGVLIEFDGSVTTFLPQVWDKINDRTEFMQRLCLKAGWERNTWRSPLASISVYQVESFEAHPEENRS